MQETKGDLWPDKKITMKSSFPSYQGKTNARFGRTGAKERLTLKTTKSYRKSLVDPPFNENIVQ